MSYPPGMSFFICIVPVTRAARDMGNINRYLLPKHFVVLLYSWLAYKSLTRGQASSYMDKEMTMMIRLPRCICLVGHVSVSGWQIELRIAS